MGYVTENVLMDIGIESSVSLKKINYIWPAGILTGISRQENCARRSLNVVLQIAEIMWLVLYIPRIRFLKIAAEITARG